MTVLDRLLRAATRTAVGAVALVVPLATLAVTPEASAEASAVARAEAAGTTDPCALTAVLENPCRPLLGAESNGYVQGATFPVRMADHETRIGRPVDLVHIYVTSNPTMTALEKTVASRPDKVALVNWRLSTSWASAAGGSLDSQIATMATDLKTIPHQVMLTLGHEPELHTALGGDPACPVAASSDLRGTTTDYVNMWHHVRERFDAAGVTNVVWVMDYLGYSSFFACAKALWPGNDYVDWVMWDPYPNGLSYRATVGGFYDHLTQSSDSEHAFTSKPWGLAEWGYAGRSQAAAYTMYADAVAALHANTFPRLKAYLIWDNVVTGGGNDDRVGFDNAGVEDPAEQAAYNSFANDPTFSPDLTAPATVTGLAAGPVTASSAQLSWSASIDAVRVAGYRVYRDGTLVRELPAESRTFTDAGLADGHTYAYDVRAVDPSTNESGASAGVSVTTPDVSAPTTPGSLLTTPGRKQVVLSWTASSDNVGVSGYRVLRNGTRLLPDPTGTTFTDTGLNELTTYSYSVVAVDAAGNVGPAATQTARTLDSTAPQAPARPRATVSGRSVALTWTRPADNVGVVSYEVYRGTTLVARPTTTSFTDAAPPQGRSLSYWVRAVDGAGNASVGSGSAAVTVPDTTAPSAPPTLTAVGGSKRVTLTWAKATDNVAVTGYWVYRGSTRIATLAGTVTSYASTGLRTGTSYTYQLVAVDAAGNRSAARSAKATAK